MPSVTVISHHFTTKNALAMGIVFSGTSIGGTIYPIMLNRLINGEVGFANGVRATTAVIAGTLVAANLLMRAEPALRSRRKLNLVKMFTDIPFVMCLLA